MSSREIAARLGMTTEQLWGWTRKWGVEKPEGVSLWRRADLDAVLPPTRYCSDHTPRCQDSAEDIEDDEKSGDGSAVLAA